MWAMGIGCAQTRLDLRWKNKPAPDFELTALDGGKVRLASYFGRPVLLTFWGHTCPPCHAEAPHLSQLAQDHRQDGLAVLAVNAWNDDKQDIHRFVKRGKLKQRMLLDGASVAEMYKVTSVPTTLWIDRKGIIVDTEIGFEGVKTLRKETARLLARAP